jgi:hypothetical protein
MPKRTVKPQLSWPLAFAYAWVDLAEGQADVEDLLSRGVELQFKNRSRDPRKVAAKDFAQAIAPNRDLIPGWNAP